MAKLQGLDRGLSALKILSAAQKSVSVAELAKLLGVDRAVVYRVVETLEEHGLVVRVDNGLRLGAEVVSLAQGFHPQLMQAAEPVLRRLADEARSSAFLTIAKGSEYCIPVLGAEPSVQDSMLHVSYRIGIQHALTRGANGIAILGALPERPGELAEVARARELGFSVTSGHLQQGATGVAAGFLAPGNVGASVSIVTVNKDEAERFVPMVVNAAELLAEISRR